MDAFLLTSSTAADMTIFTKQEGLSVGQTVDLRVSVTNVFDRTTCEAMNFICFSTSSAPEATFNEENLDNNVHCEDINANKNCAPDIKVSVNLQGVDSEFKFVRGYEGNTTFSVNATNTDTTFDIVPLDITRYNFNLTMFYSDANVTNEDVQTFSNEQLYLLDDEAFLYGGLETGNTIQLSGKIWYNMLLYAKIEIIYFTGEIFFVMLNSHVVCSLQGI